MQFFSLTQVLVGEIRSTVELLFSDDEIDDIHTLKSVKSVAQKTISQQLSHVKLGSFTVNPTDIGW